MADFPKLPRLRVDDENMEKFHCGARKGLIVEVKRLVEQGVDPAISNKFGCTALHLACKFGNVEIARYLASLCDSFNFWHGRKPFHLAVLANNADLVDAVLSGAKERGRNIELIINEIDEVSVDEVNGYKLNTEGQSALHWCVVLGDDYLPMLRLLVSLGASPTTKNKEGVTSLMYAIKMKNEIALEEMLKGVKPQQLRLDYQDKKGRTHLHYAIFYNREDYALRFIELGHDIQIEDEDKNPPLFFALRAAMVQLLTYLLQHVEAFAVQQAPFHNGSLMLPERIEWFPFATDEQAQTECIRLFQKRLDEVSYNPEAVAKKKKPALKKMKLAPSAPIRSRSVTNQQGVRKKVVGNHRPGR